MTRTLTAIALLLALVACTAPTLNSDGTAKPDACGPEMPGTGAEKAVTSASLGIVVGAFTGPVGAGVLIVKDIAQSECKATLRKARQEWMHEKCTVAWHPVCGALGFNKPVDAAMVKEVRK